MCDMYVTLDLLDPLDSLDALQSNSIESRICK